MKLLKIVIYTTPTGKEPYSEWEDALDKKTQAVISKRLDRIRLGNFDDCKSIMSGQGIKELVVDYGPGYRIYYGIHKQTIVILLAGGQKRTQSRDIEKARKYWNECKDTL